MLLNYIPYGYMNVVPLIYLLTIGYNTITIGIVYAVSSVAAMAGLVPSGILTDRYGRKKFLIIAAVTPALSYAIFGLSTNPSWLIVASIIGGVGIGGGLASAIQTPALLSTLAGGAPEPKRATLIALVQVDWVVAQGVGAVLSFLPSLLQSTFNLNFMSAHSMSYFLMSALAIASTIPLLFVTEKDRDLAAETGYVPHAVASSAVNSRARRFISSKAALLKFSLVYALSGLGVGVAIQLLPTWYNLRFGISEGTAGLWMSIALVPSLVAVPLIPRLIRRKGTLFTLVSSGSIATLLLMLMVVPGQFETVALLFVGRSVFWSISWPVLQSYMVGSAKVKERATVVGVTNAAWDGASAAATFVGGYLLQMGLLYVPFLIASASFFAMMLLILIFFRKKVALERSSG